MDELSVMVGAHRLYNKEPWRRRHQLAQIVEHKWFSLDSYEYDVMLLRLSRPIKYSKKVRPICVDEDVKRPPGTPCVVSGWGSTSRDTDRTCTICQNQLQQFLHSKSIRIWSGQKSVVSFMQCCFPNYITTTSCQVIVDLLVTGQTILKSSGYTYMRMVESETRNKPTSSVPSTKMNRAFKVIQGHPCLCRTESRTACCRNVQLMPTLFQKLTKIWQRENGKFVGFNDPTQL